MSHTEPTLVAAHTFSVISHLSASAPRDPICSSLPTSAEWQLIPTHHLPQPYAPMSVSAADVSPIASPDPDEHSIELEHTIPLPPNRGPLTPIMPALVRRLLADGVLSPAEATQIRALQAGAAPKRGHRLLLQIWLAADRAGRRTSYDGTVLRPDQLCYPGIGSTPFRPDNFACLMQHALPAQTAFLLDGFRNGFSLHRRGAWTSVSFPQQPAPSEHAHNQLVLSETRERAAGRVGARPDTMRRYQRNPRFQIPKKSGGQWNGTDYRLCDHLSFGDAVHPSVNSQIDPALGSITYVTIDTLAGNLQELINAGHATPCVNIADCADAYRIFPLRPAEYESFGYLAHDGIEMYNAFLMFGVLDACRLYSALSNTVGWLLNHVFDLFVIVYIDDFLDAVEDPTEAAQSMEIIESVFELLGIATKPSKLVTGAQVPVALGLQVDIPNRTIGFAPPKLERILTMVAHWLAQPTMTLHDLQVVTGVLNDAVRVIPAGKIFLRRLYASMHHLESRPYGRIDVHREMKLDFRWWERFLKLNNHTRKFINPAAPIVPTHFSWGDASDLKIGGTHKDTFFMMAMTGDLERYDKAHEPNIAVREMLAVCYQAYLYGPEWEGRHIRFYCDNQGDVKSFKKMMNKNKLILHLMRVIAYLAALLGFSFEIEWLASESNTVADAASRLSLEAFLEKYGPLTRVETTWCPPILDDEDWEEKLSVRLQAALLGRRARQL